MVINDTPIASAKRRPQGPTSKRINDTQKTPQKSENGASTPQIREV
ncbi:hypothetical protein TYRP_023123 [Tyrophagus putrescentiae]|nr:hypothetical protein TYRP_023123 [Tyrophagus putrescentiae]